MHPTPRASTSPPGRSFPKPEPYAIPPRAGDGARHLGGADRTALSSDYLRAAREAALGRTATSEPRVNEAPVAAGAPSQRVLGNRAAFSTTPASRSVLDSHADRSPPSFATQQSIGSEPPPARARVSVSEARSTPVHGTVLEAPGALPLPALPDLPSLPPSERNPAASASKFEPVPAARTHLSERGAPALSGQSLAHISVDWSPELADRVRSAVPAPKSRTGRLLMLGVGALLLVVLGFVTLGGPLRRLVTRASRATTTGAERAPENAAAPSVTTLSNQPAAAPADPPSGEPQP